MIPVTIESVWIGVGASEFIYDVIAFDTYEAINSTGRDVAGVADGVDFLMLDNGGEQ